MFEKFHRGDIYSADLSPGIGSEQSGSRPVLILQNNVGNCFSPTIIIAAITSVNIIVEHPVRMQGRNFVPSIRLQRQQSFIR